MKNRNNRILCTLECRCFNSVIYIETIDEGIFTRTFSTPLTNFHGYIDIIGVRVTHSRILCDTVVYSYPFLIESPCDIQLLYDIHSRKFITKFDEGEEYGEMGADSEFMSYVRKMHGYKVDRKDVYKMTHSDFTDYFKASIFRFYPHTSESTINLLKANDARALSIAFDTFTNMIKLDSYIGKGLHAVLMKIRNGYELYGEAYVNAYLSKTKGNLHGTDITKEEFVAMYNKMGKRIIHYIS